VHKGSTQTNKRSKLGFKKKEAKRNGREPWSGAPDCPVCHRTVSGAPGPYDFKLFTFGFLQRRSAIIHRTVWCATGLSGAPAEQRLASVTVACKLQCTDSSRRSQSSRQKAHRTVNSTCLVRHRTVRCNQKPALQWSKPSEP
jgi:hypothetical protein